jgi:hypothetical protein
MGAGEVVMGSVVHIIWIRQNLREEDQERGQTGHQTSEKVVLVGKDGLRMFHPFQFTNGQILVGYLMKRLR